LPSLALYTFTVTLDSRACQHCFHVTHYTNPMTHDDNRVTPFVNPMIYCGNCTDLRFAVMSITKSGKLLLRVLLLRSLSGDLVSSGAALLEGVAYMVIMMTI
jgi:hypothetical protein